MIELLKRNKAAIAELCRRFGVQRLDLFGSAVSGEFDPSSSDLDFIACFVATESPGYADRYYDFALALEHLLQRKVDLITEGMIRNPYFREEIRQSRETVYEERGKEMFA